MRTLSITALALVTFQIGLTADELELADDSKLKGVLKAITPEGVVIADLDISESPVELLADKVMRVQFGRGKRKFDHDTMLTFSNGDRLPCDLRTITESELTVDTDYAGTLTIPRKVITSAQLGIRPRKTIFSGPVNLKNWEFDENWRFEDGSLVSEGRGPISREFDELPDSFSLSFHLKWVGKPMLKVYFLSESPKVNDGKQDRYYIQIGSAGVELKRQSSGKNPYLSLITESRSLETAKEREISIELNYDHRQQHFQLYVDGKLEGQAIDPLPVIPEGKNVILQSDSSSAEAHRVSGITLRDWNSAGERHRSEDRGDFGEDSLINNKGERFGGRLIESKGPSGKMVLLFKSPLSPDPLPIPSNEVSTLFFEQSEAEESASTPLVLGLAGSGSIAARACTFGPEDVSLTHPLLGELKLSRDVVVLLQRREWPEHQDSETKPESDE